MTSAVCGRAPPEDEAKNPPPLALPPPAALPRDSQELLIGDENTGLVGRGGWRRRGLLREGRIALRRAGTQVRQG